MVVVERRWFHVWVKPGCVTEHVHAGGFCIPRRTYQLIEVDGKVERSQRLGDYLHLTEGELRRIVDGLKRRVQRRIGPTGKIFATDSPYYSPTERDEPLVDYVAIEPCNGPPVHVQPAEPESDWLKKLVNTDVLEFPGAKAARRKVEVAKATGQPVAASSIDG